MFNHYERRRRWVGGILSVMIKIKRRKKKKSIKLFTTAFSILLILNGVNTHALEADNSTFSEYKLEIIEKTELTNENINHCTSTVY